MAGIDNYVAEKTLNEGSTLRVRSWDNDSIYTGIYIYQLVWTPHERLNIQFPTRLFPRFSKDQIFEWYDAISSEEDFKRIRRKCSEMTEQFDLEARTSQPK